MKQGPFLSLTHTVETYYDELVSFIYKRTGSTILAQDVVQETWVRASKSKVNTPDNPKAYVYQMASNLAVDHLRRQRSIQKVEACSLSEFASVETSGPEDEGMNKAVFELDLINSQPSVEDVVSSQAELVILSAAVRELPPQCRHVFLLYRGKGHTMREVAEILDITVSTVEKHIARAMLHCRKILRAAGREV